MIKENDIHKQNVHVVFGSSNVMKLIKMHGIGEKEIV